MRRRALLVLLGSLLAAAAGLGVTLPRVAPSVDLARFDVEAWYGQAGPARAAALLAWAVAATLVVWLVLATTAQLLASLRSLRPLQGLADSISPRSLQRLGRGLAGLSLTAGLAAPAPSAGTPADPPPVVTVGELPEAPTTTTTSTPPAADRPGTATMRPLDAATSPAAQSGTASMRELEPSELEPAPPAVPVPIDLPTSSSTTNVDATTTTAAASPGLSGGAVEPDALAGEPASGDASATAPSARSVVVRPGDSLWSIAEAEIERIAGAPQDDATIARYWRRVVDANRAGLIDPDLIHPGQHVAVPAP